MSDTQQTDAKPHVLLFKSPSCPHCPTVVKIFRQFEQQARLAALEVHDVTAEPDLAARYDVRSVPWFRIDNLDFQGLHTTTELDYWVSHAGSAEGVKKYLIEQLEAGHLHSMAGWLKANPKWRDVLIEIIADLQSPMQACIGIGAILEELAGTPLSLSLIPGLGKLTQHAEHNVRIDACHYLGLSGDAAARPYLQACLADTDPNVREVAADALALLSA